jgi:hypothetical protein
VVGALRRLCLVEAEVQPLVGAPLKVERLHPLALEREHDVEIPGQDVDLERRVLLAELVQKLEQAHLGAGGRRLAAQQGHPAVELPA